LNEDFLREFRTLKRFFIVFGTASFLVLILTVVSPVIHVLVMLYAGVLFAVFLTGLARAAEKKFNFPYRVALGLVLVSLILISLLYGWFMGNQVIKEFSEIQSKVPRAGESVRELLKQRGWGKSLLSISNETSKLWSLGSGLVGDLTGFFSETVGIAVSLAFVLVTGIYLSINPWLYMDGVLKLFPINYRPEVNDVLNSVGLALRKWLIGRVVIMAGVGLLTTLGYLFAGIPGPLALGLLAGFLSFVPFLGPIIAVVPAALVALIESPFLLIPVAIIFVVVHSVEGYLVTPLIQQRTVSLSPVVLLTSQVIIGTVLGIPGIIIATPLTITVIVIIQRTYIEDFLGDSVKVLGET